MIEEKEITSNCSECFREHNNMCIANGLSCEMGLNHSDYLTEYRLYDKAIKYDLDIVQDNKIIPHDKHKHKEALTLAYPLNNGFIMKQKICSVCRETYEMSIYKDAFEHVVLTEKLKHWEKQRNLNK